MPRFSYYARDGRGNQADGVVAATTLEEAGRMLRTEGKFVVRLAQVREAEASTGPTSARSGRVSRDEVVFFTHQLSVMIETGVPVSEALECVIDQAGNPRFKAILSDIAQHVRAGGELSAALRKYPRAFPAVMVSLIRASEISGTMGVMLERTASYLSKEQRTFKQARGALMYPAFMLVTAVAVTIFLLSFVLPKFAAIFASRQAALPAPTRVLMAVSSSLTDYWLLWIGAALVLGAGFWFFARSTFGRRFLDGLKVRIPVLRTVYTNLYVTRACRTMGTMINSGVPMLDTIEIIKQVTSNVHYAELWEKVDEALRQGRQLSDPLFESSLIPRSVSQMIRSGEKSGRLGQIMTRVAEYTEQEFDESIRRATQFIEPLTVMVMGGIIGFIAISLLLPIFTVSTVIASK